MLLNSFDESKATLLLKEIEAFMTRRKKSNRKLARDVAEWVDTAMKISVDRKKSQENSVEITNIDNGDIHLDFDDSEEAVEGE